MGEKKAKARKNMRYAKEKGRLVLKRMGCFQRCRISDRCETGLSTVKQEDLK